MLNPQAWRFSSTLQSKFQLETELPNSQHSVFHESVTTKQSIKLKFSSVPFCKLEAAKASLSNRQLYHQQKQQKENELFLNGGSSCYSLNYQIEFEKKPLTPHYVQVRKTKFYTHYIYHPQMGNKRGKRRKLRFPVIRF